MNFWFPVKFSLGDSNIRTPLRWVVLDGWKVRDGGRGSRHLFDLLSKRLNRVLVRIAYIAGRIVAGIHESHEPLNQITDVLKGPRLSAITINRERFVLQGLNDKIGHDTAIAGVHAGTECIEDACNPCIYTILVPVSIHHGFGDPFALIVTRPWAERIHVSFTVSHRQESCYV